MAQRQRYRDNGEITVQRQRYRDNSETTYQNRCFFYLMGSNEAGGMPAPEPNPAVEEGLLLTIREGSTDPAMEPESTATNILASVKEQFTLRDCIYLAS
ncbi:UNVERIFIED_CONTAM: hypothetical protein FKN15_052008 [Acipenser sinensis]